MRNECNIIRDILPLYADKMVSADTASFVEEHLIGCAECRAELEKLKVADVIEAAVSDAENDDEKRLKAFARKINRKKTYCDIRICGSSVDHLFCSAAV